MEMVGKWPYPEDWFARLIKLQNAATEHRALSNFKIWYSYHSRAVLEMSWRVHWHRDRVAKAEEPLVAAANRALFILCSKWKIDYSEAVRILLTHKGNYRAVNKSLVEAIMAADRGRMDTRGWEIRMRRYREERRSIADLLKEYEASILAKAEELEELHGPELAAKYRRILEGDADLRIFGLAKTNFYGIDWSDVY